MKLLCSGSLRARAITSTSMIGDTKPMRNSGPTEPSSPFYVLLDSRAQGRIDKIRYAQSDIRSDRDEPNGERHNVRHLIIETREK